MVVGGTQQGGARTTVARCDGNMTRWLHHCNDHKICAVDAQIEDIMCIDVHNMCPKAQRIPLCVEGPILSNYIACGHPMSPWHFC